MSLTGRLRAALLAGVVVLAPTLVTLYVLWFLAGVVAGFLRPLARLLGLSGTLGRVVAALGVTATPEQVAVVADLLAAVVALAAVVVVGLIASNPAGRQVLGRVGRLVNLVPLADTVYGTIRMVADALVEGESRYETVVLVEYPREGVYTLGLVTGGTAAFDNVEEGLVTVFFPNSPNPTGGRLALVPRDAVHEADVSVRHGLRLLVTTGIGSDDLPSTLHERALDPAEATGRAQNDRDRP